jgi:hypothetical protein
VVASYTETQQQGQSLQLPPALQNVFLRPDNCVDTVCTTVLFCHSCTTVHLLYVEFQEIAKLLHCDQIQIHHQC